jgi:hypothetical protein
MGIEVSRVTLPRFHAVFIVLVWTCLLVCLYAIADDVVSQWDFAVYYAAAHAFAAGGNPYMPIHPHPGLNGDLVFQYPPLTLYLFQWTTLFSLPTAKVIWLVAKVVAVALLLWLWRRDFERIDLRAPLTLFIALGFNASLLRDFDCGNISTFEQVGIWLGFGLLVRERPYAAAAVLACVAQFKLLPVAFLALIPLVRPTDGWKPFFAGCAIFCGLLLLNPALSPGLTENYLGLFTNANLRMDDRGISNPSSLSLFRDILDLTSYAPGLAYNRVAGTIAYGVYLVALLLVMIRFAWNGRAALAAPRMKDYSYILMLIPTLFVVRDMDRRGIRADYLLLGAGLMTFGQPQQSNVPGLQAGIYMLQAYLPLWIAGAVLVYLLSVLGNSESRTRAPEPASLHP